MDSWGTHMINACMTAARMAAVGMGLPEETFAEKMDQGSHLLAPTELMLMPEMIKEMSPYGLSHLVSTQAALKKELGEKIFLDY